MPETTPGVVIASWAKFTALLLVGGLVGGVLLWLLWRGRLPLRWIGLIAIAALMAVAPYIVLFAQYGSPTPETPGCRRSARRSGRNES